MTEPVLVVDIQNALSDLNDEEDGVKPPSASQLTAWARAAYSSVSNVKTELTLRLVDETEMVVLNSTYRGKDIPTNVLSFPFEKQFDFQLAEGEFDEDVPPALLGDIVICHAVIQREAVAQNKSGVNHYAHMVTHGVLHLCGYDHLDDVSAQEMEALEAKILAQSNIENPYT